MDSLYLPLSLSPAARWVFDGIFERLIALFDFVLYRTEITLDGVFVVDKAYHGILAPELIVGVVAVFIFYFPSVLDDRKLIFLAGFI